MCGCNVFYTASESRNSYIDEGICDFSNFNWSCKISFLHRNEAYNSTVNIHTISCLKVHETYPIHMGGKTLELGHLNHVM